MTWYYYAIGGYLLYAALAPASLIERAESTVRTLSHAFLDPTARTFVIRKDPKLLKNVARERGMGEISGELPSLSSLGGHYATNAFTNKVAYHMPGGGIILQDGLPIQMTAPLGSDYARDHYGWE